MTVVLHVTEKLERHGGTPRKLLYLTQHSDPARQRHCFVTFVPGDLDDEVRAAGARVFNVGSANVTSVSRAVFQVARAERANVLITHFTRALVCGVAMARVLRLPAIHCAHGPASEQPREGFVGRLGRMTSRWCYPATTLVTANSRFTADTLRRVFDVPEEKLRVIPCPVAPRQPTHVGMPNLPPRTGALRLVQIGGLIPVRKQVVLLHGLAILVGAGMDCELLMVGDGPLAGELKAICCRLGIETRVHWLGFRDDVGDVLSSADLYVSATDTEGFGIAVVEAMLQGLPVVLADGGAHRELVDNGRHGELFAPGNPHDLAQKILALWSDRQRRGSMVEAARAHAARDYTPRRYAERFLEVVEEVRQP